MEDFMMRAYAVADYLIKCANDAYEDMLTNEVYDEDAMRKIIRAETDAIAKEYGVETRAESSAGESFQGEQSGVSIRRVE